MEFKVPVGISNRHVHLTRETYFQLFKEELVNVRDLKQLEEFAGDKFVNLKGPKGEIDHVRVLGPYRNYNQVEVSPADAYSLGITPPVSHSGQLENASPITIVGEIGEVSLEHAAIMAQCHIHMSYDDLKKYQVQDNQVVKVHIKGQREGIMFAHIKASPKGVLEFHVDRDEGNAFLLHNDDELTVEP